MYQTHHSRFLEKLLGYISEHMPTQRQDDIIRVYQDLYSITHDWKFKDREFSYRDCCERIEELFHWMEARMPLLHVVISDSGAACSLELPEGMSTLACTKGVRNYVLVKVENRSSIPEHCSFRGLLYPGASRNLKPDFPDRQYILPEITILKPGESLPSVLVLPELPRETTENFGVLSLQYASSARTSLRVSFEFSAALLDPAKLVIHTRSNEGTFIPGKLKVTDHSGILRSSIGLGTHPTLTLKPIIAREGMYQVETFYTTGTAEVLLPQGFCTVEFRRGLEWELSTWEGYAEDTGTIELTSRPLVGMSALQWISGDTHNHWVENTWDVNEDLELLKLVQRAEDIQVLNDLTLYQWLPRGPFVKPDHSPMGRIEGCCDDRYHIQMGEEYRNDHLYGHINLLGITECIEPISVGMGSGGGPLSLDYPTNKQAIDQAHAQGGLVCEAHGMGPYENSFAAVHALMGLSDVLDQLDPFFYYKLLDAGVKLPLGNGSDHPARLIGDARCYVRIDRTFSYDAWLEGFRNKASFVTSGPLIVFNINTHKTLGTPRYSGPGSTLKCTAGEPLSFEISAWSQEPLGRVEVVSSGGEAVFSTETGEKFLHIEGTLTAAAGTWFCARISRTSSFSAIDTLEYDYRARRGTAHTSAVYIDVPGTSAVRTKAVEFWLAQVEQLRNRVHDQGVFADQAQRDEALSLADDCINYLKNLLHSSK